MRRRSLLLGTLAAAAPLAGHAQGALAAGPLRLGADIALVDSGLAGALRQAFGRDTGIGVQLVRSPARTLLDALAAGELDAGLANAPDAEAQLDSQGLVYDRQPIASGEFVLVGPAGATRARGRPGSKANAASHSAAERSIAAALGRLRDAASAAPGGFNFLSANDGSGAHFAELAAWRRAGIAPQAPWYRSAEPGSSLVAEARARGAYALVERGAWTLQGGAPLALRVAGDPAGIEAIHAMRSFRSPHPAAKLFIAWIAGGRGRAVVARQRGYRALRG